MSRAALLFLALLPALPAKGYVIQQNVPLTFEAGSFCNYPADAKERAPETFDGEISLHDLPYRFIHAGDRAPAMPDVAIGLIVQLKSFTPGETLTIESFRFEDMREPDRWQHVVSDDGKLWIGRIPDQGKGLPFGHYQMAILRGKQRLFVYDFRVVPTAMMPEFTADCAPAIS